LKTSAKRAGNRAVKGARKAGRKAVKRGAKTTRKAARKVAQRLAPAVREVVADAAHVLAERIRLRAAPAELTSQAVHTIADVIDEENRRANSES
jgi:hypothetical protein